MSAIEIKKGVYWVGAVDWDIRNFHGPSYHTQKGTTYNAYLVIDEKVTLIDLVDLHFVDDMINNIKEIIDPSLIDYVVVNHVEPDHSGAFPKLMEYIPEAKVFCTKNGKEGMLHYYFGDYNYETVKTGDKLNIGEKTLEFIEAPMLHWPDSMFTYIKEVALLMPNDAFGQHLASSHRFDDENDLCEVMEEAKKYYANILMPFNPLVLKKIQEIQKMGLEFDMIAPSHGIIWRTDPGKIVEKYLSWSQNETKRKAVVVYDTMWNSTQLMAKAIVDGLISEGIETKLYRASKSDVNDIMTEVLDAKAVLIASSTINNTMLPHLAYLLEEMMGLKPKKKIGAAFGSYGWGKGAVKNIEKKMKETGIELVKEGLEIKYVPTEADLKTCFEYGKEIGKMIE
ncbi:flavodoxin/nitric oxide synthase [Alkaliphilus metalliredigens QYMF]|uniref:Flavodoxin/nitric oxide synthase n=1 Tax=Alkaliphilus metalliredigens (strain QYMF) TaxID=293826 RepID=A6TNV5_ALKMQ|nr:flavodoxin domain-containing protein [Alkaliphilus metalliredigens]ABR47873.1 flavodoxin/nitric oxide synthase [Alkaliphilus metalliredigens QYMF]